MPTFAALAVLTAAAVHLATPEPGLSPWPITREASQSASMEPKPLPGAPQPRDSLSLEEAIRLALARNPQVTAARWEMEAAGERRNLAAAFRLPYLATSGSFSRFSSTQRLLPPTGPGQPMVYTEQAGGVDIGLEVPVYLGGRLRHQVQASALIQESFSHRLDQTEEQLVFEVSSAFYTMLRQERVVRSIEFAVQAMEAHERTVREMMEAGKAARVDVLRTEVRLADLRQRLLTERNALEVQRRVLAYLLRWEEERPLPDPRGTLTLVPFEDSLQDGVEAALSRRPDLLSARAVRQAQAHRVDAARAGRWPALHLRGSYAERWAISPLEQPPGSNRSPSLGSLGLAMSLPLFDGGRISAQVGEERALLAAGEERLADLELLVRLQVEEAFLGVQSSRGRVEATEASIQQGQETLRIEQEKYRLGKGSITDVLDAQSELLGAETTHFEALADYHTALARYRLVTGGEP